ncbi:MAG: FG-GAP-like repeat-containing protein, partial [Candidatus Latescibacterota bacterium]
QRLGELPPPVPEPEAGPGRLFGPAVYTTVGAGGLRMNGLAELSSAVGDLDGDGDLDMVEGVGVVGGDLVVDQRYWFLFDVVGGRFERVRVDSLDGRPPRFECGADVDGDGRMEVLVSTADGAALVRYGGEGQIPALHTFPGTLYPLGFGDAEGDGDMDLLMVRRDVEPVRVVLFANDGHGNLAQEVEIPRPPSAQGWPLRLADTWHHAVPQRAIVWGLDDPSEGLIVTHVDRAQRVVEERLAWDAGPYTLLRYVGDYDRDDDLDVVSADTQHPRWPLVHHGVSYWINASGNLTRQSWLADLTSHPDNLGPNLGMLDLNGDGVLDPVLWELDVRGNALLVGLGRSNALPEFEGRYPVVEGAAGRVFGGDVEGDGDVDLVLLHGSPGIHVLLNRTLGGTAVVRAGTTSPGTFSLGAAYPNPFNPQTWIPFEVKQGEMSVRLEVFSALGQLVRTLAAGPQTPGRHVVPWDGRDEEGRDVGAGVFLCRLQAGTWQRNGKVAKVD